MALSTGLHSHVTNVGQWVYDQQTLCFRFCLLILADFLRLISGAFPSPHTSSIQEHIIITIYEVVYKVATGSSVGSAKNDQLARLGPEFESRRLDIC